MIHEPQKEAVKLSERLIQVVVLARVKVLKPKTEVVVTVGEEALDLQKQSYAHKE